MSQRRVSQLISVERMTLRYEHHRDRQEALRIRLRELAGNRVRYGYRRLTVLLKREGWKVNAKRIYRLYVEEGPIVRTKKRKERAQRHRVAQGSALRQRGLPESITVDNETESTSKALDHWAYRNGVHLNFIPPGRPVENDYIESFNGKLRDECLNVEVSLNLADARRKLHLWRRDYKPPAPALCAGRPHTGGVRGYLQPWKSGSSYSPPTFPWHDDGCCHSAERQWFNAVT